MYHSQSQLDLLFGRHCEGFVQQKNTDREWTNVEEACGIVKQSDQTRNQRINQCQREVDGNRTSVEVEMDDLDHAGLRHLTRPADTRSTSRHLKVTANA